MHHHRFSSFVLVLIMVFITAVPALNLSVEKVQARPVFQESGPQSLDSAPYPPTSAAPPACGFLEQGICIANGTPINPPAGLPPTKAAERQPRKRANFTAFIPMASYQDMTPGIKGYLAYQGAPKADIELNLMLWNGSAMVNVMTTTTGTDGIFRFLNAPSLEQNQYYFTTFYNTQNGSSFNYLAYYQTRILTRYTAGGPASIGQMEIANISPVDPFNFQMVGLPNTFRWANRPYAAGDNALLVIHKMDGAQLFSSPALGNVDTYDLSGLPANLVYGENYLWKIQVLQADGGTGWGWSYAVNFVQGKEQSGIQGKVTSNGTPVSGVTLWLVLQHSDGNWYADYSTQTLADGSYCFTPADLADNKPFYVFYRNGSGWSTFNSAYLRSWASYYLFYYKNGYGVAGGNFDLGNLGATTPANAEIRQLPVAFQWTARQASPTDSYQIQFCDKDCTAFSETSLLGFVSSYTLPALPAGFYANQTSYIWHLWISDSWGGWGRTFDSLVQFSATAPAAGIQGRVTYQGVPASGINLLLRYWDGSAYVTSKQTKVQANGSYIFTGVSPTASEYYYVRYSNSTGGGNVQNSSYLWNWASYSISYNSGASMAGGDFDIADVALLTPDNHASLALPVTFTWTRRAATPGDSYSVGFEDTTNSWESSAVGYENNLTLSGIASDMSYGTFYTWYVFVNGPWGDYGISFGDRQIAFLSSANDGAEPELFRGRSQYPAEFKPAPREGIPQGSQR